MSIAIFFGSTTGNTMDAADAISEALGDLITRKAEICDIEPADLLKYDVLIFGVPTWNIGELQIDYEDFLPELKGLDLSGKKIALFGLGDAYGYGDNFLDALGLLWDELKGLGSPTLIGKWPTKGYDFDESKGKYDEDHFLGLGLDVENQSEMHSERIEQWTTQIRNELAL